MIQPTMDDTNSNANANENNETPTSFPARLHSMLEDAEAKGFSHIISWMPGLEGFRAHKPQDFEKLILPDYFVGQTKYRSFQRQLNLYNFERVTNKGPHQGAYVHQYFIRNNKELCSKITRKRMKKKTTAATASLPSMLTGHSSNIMLGPAANQSRNYGEVDANYFPLTDPFIADTVAAPSSFPTDTNAWEKVFRQTTSKTDEPRSLANSFGMNSPVPPYLLHNLPQQQEPTKQPPKKQPARPERLNADGKPNPGSARDIYGTLLFRDPELVDLIIETFSEHKDVKKGDKNAPL